MPTENERKYVLLLDRSILNEIRKRAIEFLIIEQSYIKEGSGWSLRIRNVLHRELFIQNNKSIPQFTATYKQKVNNRQIEIEQIIDELDYHDLKSISVGTFIKHRYIVPYGQYVWEIDSFHTDWDDLYPYFIMAEVELGDEIEPKYLPDFITDFLVYKVGEDESGFSSKKLRNKEYAENLYNQIRERS